MFSPTSPSLESPSVGLGLLPTGLSCSIWPPSWGGCTRGRGVFLGRPLFLSLVFGPVVSFGASLVLGRPAADRPRRTPRGRAGRTPCRSRRSPRRSSVGLPQPLRLAPRWRFFNFLVHTHTQGDKHVHNCFCDLHAKRCLATANQDGVWETELLGVAGSAEPEEPLCSADSQASSK